MFNKLLFLLPLVLVVGLPLDGRNSVAATSSSAYRKKLRSRGGDVAEGDRQLGVIDESFDSASHDNSHDVASASSSSDAAAMESSSSQDESSSPDYYLAAAVTNSNDESFDSASHDNSHDVSSASSADCASISKFQSLIVTTFKQYLVHSIRTHTNHIHGMRYYILIATFLFASCY